MMQCPPQVLLHAWGGGLVLADAAAHAQLQMLSFFRIRQVLFTLHYITLQAPFTSHYITVKDSCRCSPFFRIRPDPRTGFPAPVWLVLGGKGVGHIGECRGGPLRHALMCPAPPRHALMCARTPVMNTLDSRGGTVRCRPVAMACVVDGISPLLNHEERNRGTARSPARDHAAVPVRRAHAQGHIPLVRPLGQVHERAVRAAHRAHAQLRRRGREGPRARVRAVNEREGQRALSICMRLRGRVAPLPVAPTTGHAGRKKGHENCRAIARGLGTPT